MTRLRTLGTVLAVPAAVALTVLAVDVLRVPARVAADDARFHGAPNRQRALWDDVDLLPGRPAVRLLGIEDDLGYRRTAWTYTRIDPRRVVFAGPNLPQLETLRAKAQLELTTRSRSDDDAFRRARLLNGLGVMSATRATSPNPAERDLALRTAVESFRNAVRLDPQLDEAKANLELALRGAEAASLPGEAPDAGAAHGSVSGRGRSGSGY